MAIESDKVIIVILRICLRMGNFFNDKILDIIGNGAQMSFFLLSLRKKLLSYVS